MTKRKFISSFMVFIKQAARLNEKRRMHGLSSLENEVEDLDDEFFKQGLRLIIDKTDPAIINEIFSNKIAFEKNKYMRRYMTIVKRAALAIQEGLNTRLLVLVLFSLADLPKKEQHQIECELMKD